MALHTELDIHRDAYALLRALTRMIKDMPRDFKVSIGNRLRDEAVNIMVLIFNANACRDKEKYLLKLIERVQVTEFMLRLARDEQWISVGKYAEAIKLTVSIGKQANGWRKQQASRPFHDGQG